MEKKVKLVCIVVGILGAYASAASFAAEATRVKEHQIRYVPPSDCIYPSSPALALGLTAAVALMTAQTITSVATGCLCCRRQSFPLDLKQTAAAVCSTLSWFAYVVAFLLLLLGAALNDKRTGETAYFSDYYCYAIKDGIFAMAGVFSFATTTLGILSYTLEESAKNRGDPWSPSVAPEQPEIAMELPERSPDVVFILRRQIA